MSLVEYKKRDHLATITMNRPDKMNALDADMLTGLRESWIRYRDDDEAWLAIFTGAGRVFSAGADKSWFVKGLQGEDFLSPFVNTISKDPYWREIEQVITSFEAVQECAVIGVADDDWGEAVKAVVELSPGKTISDKEIIALCKQHLARYKAPKSVEFVESLPKNPLEVRFQRENSGKSIGQVWKEKSKRS